MTSELEPGPDQMRRLVEQAMERIVTHIASLPAQPAADVDGGAELARSLIEPLPERPTPYDELLSLLFDRAIPKSFNTAGPGYLAYIPGGGLFQSAVADLIASATNRYVGVWVAAPALAQLEANVVRWFCGIVGYSDSAGGVLTSGGSLANLTALITARRERLPEDFLAGTIYASDQTHHSVRKAALLAGFPPSRFREVPTDEDFRVRLPALTRMLDEDRRSGLVPFLVVGNAGTTNTGAVDDLTALADLARDERLWLHVDAAYGGFFLLSERGRRVMRGIERADSITLDPHKGLFLPYGTGCVLARDAGALRRAHSQHADYLPAMQHDPQFVDFCELSPELSRGFRGLRAWLPLKLVGIGPFRQQIEEKLDLAAWAAAALREIPHLEVVAEPQLSTVAFRVRPPGVVESELNELNRGVLERVNARKRVYLTGTIVGGRFVIRICVVSFRTHRDRVEAAVDDVRAAAEDAAGRG